MKEWKLLDVTAGPSQREKIITYVNSGLQIIAFLYKDISHAEQWSFIDKLKRKNSPLFI